jgi:cysteine synthase
MPDASRYHILGAFLLGVALSATLSHIKARHEAGHELKLSEGHIKQYKRRLSQFSKIQDEEILRKSIVELAELPEGSVGDIKEGIEGCIGATPLIKIKSLSEATGCEILAKAEVFGGNIRSE